MSKQIKVFIVDDSAVVRMALAKSLNKFSDIEITGYAGDPYEARTKILKIKPNVIILDIQMPKMDGLSFLKRLMTFYPISVIMFSALTRAGRGTTLECLAAGAIDFVSKPSSYDIKGGSNDIIKELYEKIIIASKSKIIKKDSEIKKTGVRLRGRRVGGIIKTKRKIIAIGASTGGPEALTAIISRMPADSPGILIVQHMPGNFTTSFAARLNSLSAMEVKEAKDNDVISTGIVLLAPGNFHMSLKRMGTKYYVRVEYGDSVNRHRPSIEVLFNSVAKYAGQNSIGVILTGMGKDGASGLLNMKNAGAKTVAQNEYSCIVYGMPKEAVKLGAVDKICNLNKIPEVVISML